MFVLTNEEDWIENLKVINRIAYQEWESQRPSNLCNDMFGGIIKSHLIWKKESTRLHSMQQYVWWFNKVALNLKGEKHETLFYVTICLALPKGRSRRGTPLFENIFGFLIYLSQHFNLYSTTKGYVLRGIKTSPRPQELYSSPQFKNFWIHH